MTKMKSGDERLTNEERSLVKNMLEGYRHALKEQQNLEVAMDRRRFMRLST